MRANGVVIVALMTTVFAACSSKTIIVPGTSPDRGDASVSVTAPGDGGGGGEAATGINVCATYCGRAGQCDKTRDVQTCTDACTAANAAVFPKLRDDVLSKIVTCVKSRDCKSTFGGNVLDFCAREAAAQVAPSPAGIAYCNDLATAQTKCGHTFDHVACLEAVKLYADATIGQASSCAVKACADIDACVDTALAGRLATIGAGDGGAPARDAEVTHEQDSGTADDFDSGLNGCSPGDVSGFVPLWKPPTGQHQGKCTQSQITAYYTGCLGPSATQQACTSATAAANANCMSCLTTQTTSGDYGPIVSGNGLLVLNVAGCVALLDPGNTSCARALQATSQCTHVACDARCPVSGDASLQAFDRCTQNAEANACQSYVSTCGDTEANGGPAAACFFQTFEEGFNVLAPLFCGL